jgi:hypothetical protein
MGYSPAHLSPEGFGNLHHSNDAAFRYNHFVQYHRRSFMEPCALRGREQGTHRDNECRYEDLFIHNLILNADIRYTTPIRKIPQMRREDDQFLLSRNPSFWMWDFLSPMTYHMARETSHFFHNAPNVR